jgi:F-type H+-transporting ATPase subunit gamma
MGSSQQDIKDRIDSVKNIAKITRAMEMVAAARLRKAEQRIEVLRPYADAIRRMTRQAAEAAGDVPNLPILQEREVKNVGLLLIGGDRGLAGAFNSSVVRAGTRRAREHEREGRKPVYFASGRRIASSLTFRGVQLADSFTGFTDRPAYADARRIAERLIAAYVDEEVDQVDIFYNRYKSAMSQDVVRETLLPLQKADILDDEEDEDSDSDSDSEEGRSGSDDDDATRKDRERDKRALVEYEPDPEEILKRLVPDYVEVSIFRALLESTASEHGSRMTAMRQASDNAGELIDDLTLEMNRARQAEITQEIMEVVGGAEALSG